MKGLICGTAVMALDLLLNACASVTKQYNLAAVNRHTMQCAGPMSVVLQLCLVS